MITWSCQPLGDGISWPVVEGSDQYTLTRCYHCVFENCVFSNKAQVHNSKRQHALTKNVFTSREQLRQKEDKRGRTREYQIVIHYSGKWLPLSQVKNPEFDLVLQCNLHKFCNSCFTQLSCVYLRQLCFFLCSTNISGLWCLYPSSLH